MSRTNNPSRLGITRMLGGVALAGVMAMSLPTLAAAHDYDRDAYGNENITQGPVHTTEGDSVPVAWNQRTTTDDQGDITVTSPRGESRTTSSGMPIETTWSRDYVSYNDLDLTTRYGRDRLMDRVALAASDACRRVDDNSLDSDLALDQPGDCTDQAINDARPQVDGAIDSATPVAYAPDNTSVPMYDATTPGGW